LEKNINQTNESTMNTSYSSLRDEKLKYAIGKWMEVVQENRKGPNEDPSVLWDIEWKLEKINGESSDDNNYSLIIPKFHTLGTVDVRVPTHNKDIFLLKKEKIIQSHYLDSGENMAKRFRDFFLPYAYIDHETKLTTSFIDVYSMCDDSNVIYLLFEVVYFDDHIPFPVPTYSIEQLEEVIDHLDKENSKKSERIDQLQNHTFQLNSQIMTLNDIMHTRCNRMNQIILQQYTESGKMDNCPVCLIDIQPEKLVIPDCCHFICRDCSQRCTTHHHLKCPICREVSVVMR